MTNPAPDSQGGADQKGERLPDADLGGADAVEKTTYVVGDGTEPEARSSGQYIARDAARSGGGIALWLVVILAALIGIVYAIGLFR